MLRQEAFYLPSPSYLVQVPMGAPLRITDTMGIISKPGIMRLGTRAVFKNACTYDMFFFLYLFSFKDFLIPAYFGVKL